MYGSVSPFQGNKEGKLPLIAFKTSSVKKGLSCSELPCMVNDRNASCIRGISIVESHRRHCLSSTGQFELH